MDINNYHLQARHFSENLYNAVVSYWPLFDWDCHWISAVQDKMPVQNELGKLRENQQYLFIMSCDNGGD